MKVFSYTCREKTGALRQGTLKAEDRSSVLATIKSWGCVPVALEERQGTIASRRMLWGAVSGAFAVLLCAYALVRLFSPDPNSPDPEPLAVAAVPAVSVPSPAVTWSRDSEPDRTGPELAPPLATASPVREPARQPAPAAPERPVTSVRADVSRSAEPPVEEVAEPEEQKPPPFTTMTDQSLAMILSVPPGVEMPPLPDLHAVGMEEDLLKALQNSIVIQEDDSDALVLRKDEVARAKGQLVAAVAQGWSPADVLHEYALQHNEDADYRRQVVHAFQALVQEGKTDVPHIHREMDRINAALADYDLPPVTADEIGLAADPAP